MSQQAPFDPAALGFKPAAAPAPAATAAATPAPAATPAFDPAKLGFKPAAAPAAPAAGFTPEKPFDTVQRLQPKIDDGSASQDERNQWLDARTKDLHDTSFADRVARVAEQAPYSKMAGQAGAFLADTAKNAVSTGLKLGAPLLAATPSNVEGAAKAAGSAALGAISEGGAIGKAVLSAAEGAKETATGAILNIFHPGSDWAPRIQALQELNDADEMRTIQPGAVKALAPDQAAAGTGAAAVDAASAVAGPEQVEAKAALAPKNVEVIGSEALKAQADAKKLASLTTAAQKAADLAPPGSLKAAAQYGVQAIKSIPVVGKVVDVAANTGKAVKAAAQGTATLAKNVATSPLAQRTAAGAAIGGVVGAASAAPGDQPSAFAQGAEGGALVGAARTPKALTFANGSRPAPPTDLTLAPRQPQPPYLAEPASPAAKPTLGATTKTGEPLGPVPEQAGAGSVDAALAQPTAAKPPLTLAATQPPTEPVSRFAGGAKAVGGIVEAAQKGNEALRAQIIAGTDKVTPEIAKAQAESADKPLATVGPAPAPSGPNAEAMKVSQDLGAQLSKYQNMDRIVNTLIGGNRTGQGIPTESIRIHELPDGSKFEVNGEKATVVRPPGVTDKTIVRFDNPELTDVQVYNPVKDAEGNLQYQIPTDTGPRDIARLSGDDPNPITIGGKEHQLLAQPMGKTSAVSLADPENNRQILASRKVLNADKGTAPPEQAPVPMKSVDSSTNVKEYGYNAQDSTFHIRLKNGTLYAYRDVPIEVVKAMDALPDTAEKGAMTKGKFYARNIRNDYKLVGDEEEAK